MFGTFRMFLALNVVVGHMGGSYFGIIMPGIAAVVCFFMISGYAMSGLIQVSYPRLPEDVGHFYLDRILRLGPQYYFYLAVAVFIVFVVGWRSSVCCQSGPVNFVNIFANITVIPLDFWMFSTSIDHFQLNVPAWTIGLELCFYIALPWLLYNRVSVWCSAIIGSIVWGLATHGVIDPDYFAYRLLPGTLVFFLVGVAAQRRDWPLFWCLCLFFLADAWSLSRAGVFGIGFNPHLLAGAAVGCLIVPLLSKLPRNRLDESIGAASYGCYLAHWTLVVAFENYIGETWAMIGVAALAAACGFASHQLIEKPVVQLRRAIRDRRAKSLHAATSANS